MLSFGMSQALYQGYLAEGRTAPRPPVGAVIIKDEKVIGKGFKQPGIGPHAEALALQNAGRNAEGADLYTTLEPCNHFGKTPPCTEAIIRAGIKTVHMAVIDPNPKVNGTGIARLREAGIEVFIGEGKNEALEQLRPFFTYIKTGKPVLVNLADTNLDVLDVADAVIINLPTTEETSIPYSNIVSREGRAKREDKPIRVMILPEIQSPYQLAMIQHVYPEIFVMREGYYLPQIGGNEEKVEIVKIHNSFSHEAGKEELLALLGEKECMLVVQK